jgi:hypothetical protein
LRYSKKQARKTAQSASMRDLAARRQQTSQDLAGGKTFAVV